MVAVAQLVEHRVVVPGVEGSSPFSHPRLAMAGGRTRRPFAWAPGVQAPGLAGTTGVVEGVASAGR